MDVSIYIGDDKLDLFKDETIEINSSVQDVNDITKNPLDYSKNFTIPASTVNNKILKHWYNSDIDNGFDARTKVDGRIEINGVVFKYGKFNLIGAKLNRGSASSYSLVFYGNAISLADKIGSDELSVLDLSAYDQAYNDTNVLNGLKALSGDFLYTLMAKKRYYYNSSATNDSVQSLNNHHNIANVSWANGVKWQDLRPSLRVIRIIEAIQTKYNFTFSTDFFGRYEFTELFLRLDNDKGFLEQIQKGFVVNFTNTGNFALSGVLGFQFNLTDDWISPISGQSMVNGRFDLNITPAVGYENVPYKAERWIITKNIGSVPTGPDQSSGYVTGTNSLRFNGNWYETVNYAFYVFSYEDFKFTANINAYRTGFFGFNYSATFAEQTINIDYGAKALMPKLKTIDFLKAIFNMFKLVIVQDKPTDPIFVNTLKDYYSGANLYDITEYTSSNSMDIERGKLLNEINYKYEEPQTVQAKQFKENNGIAYGDNTLLLLEDMNDPNSKKLDGDKEDIKLPFEQVYYERLTNTNPSVNAPSQIQAGLLIDDKYDAVNIKPHLHYIVNPTLDGANQIKFVKSNGTSVNVGSDCNMPSHTIDWSTNPSFSLLWDREFSTYTNVAIENSLFKNYHEDYVLSIFNIKRRNTKVDAKLPLRIILSLKLKDVLKIKDKYYRINQWSYNLLNGIAKLDLVNSFDNTINGFNASRTIINTDGLAKIESIFVTNFNVITFDFDEAWILNAYFVGNNVYFDIEANNTGVFRTEIVTLINNDTLAEIEITINQTAKIITADNNIITSDNNLITADNG